MLKQRLLSRQQLIVLGLAICGAALYTSGSLWSKIFSSSSRNETDEVEEIEPLDYAGRARHILRTTPLIDGHNDFPFLLRQQLKGKIYNHDFVTERLASHTDFNKMREGMMGGQFWSVFVPVPEDLVPGVDLHDDSRRRMDLNEPNVRIGEIEEQELVLWLMCLVVGSSRHA